MSGEETPREATNTPPEETPQVFRKRCDSLDSTQVFSKSRKTPRSPVPKRKEREDEFDTTLIIQMMKSMEYNIQENVRKGKDELKTMIKEDNKEMKKAIGEIKGEIATIKEKQDKWEEDKEMFLSSLKKQEKVQETQREKIESLENRLKNLEKHLESRKGQQESSIENKDSTMQERIKNLEMNLERKEKMQRKDNIVIKGKTFDIRNTAEEIRKFLKEKLEIDAQILETKPIKIGENEHTIVKLGSTQQKTQVMKAKSKLKQEAEKIFIENDLTFQERKIQKEIKNFAREHKGKEVKIGYQKVTVEGREYKWDYKTSSVIESLKVAKN